MLLERKGVDAVTVANHLRLLVTSNASWTVPASQDERRFFVLDVTNDKQQNRELRIFYHAARLPPTT